ncbi:MAG: hypothetical protein V1777_04330 [Candidatus Micrarchaeota archaeon]
MKTTLLVLASFFFFTGISASILPTNCNAFQGDQLQDCQNILTDSSLTVQQKEDLYLNLLENQSELASFNFAYNWNKNLQFTNPPTQTQSQGIIQNAWAKITGFEKGFYDQETNQWFVAPVGKVLFQSNYSLQIPSGTMPEDCQTNYSYTILENQKRILLNENSLGSQPETTYSLPNEDDLTAEFKAELRVHTRLQIDHFQTQQHCVYYDGYWHCWNTCDYHHTDNQEDQVLAQDTLQAKTIVPDLVVNAKFEPKNGYYQAFFQTDSNQPINRLKIEIGGGTFEYSQTAFDLNAEPNGIISITRTQKDINRTAGLDWIGFDQNGSTKKFIFAVQELAPCTLMITSDFDEKTQDCGLIELKPVFLDLSLDKNSFDQNENIQATLKLTDENQEPLASKTVFLQTPIRQIELETNQNGIAEASVPASETKGNIQAVFQGDNEFASSSQIERFPIFNGETQQTGLSVLLFFGAYYGLFLFAKKKAGAI